LLAAYFHSRLVGRDDFPLNNPGLDEGSRNPTGSVDPLPTVVGNEAFGVGQQLGFVFEPHFIGLKNYLQVVCGVVTIGRYGGVVVYLGGVVGVRFVRSLGRLSLRAAATRGIDSWFFIWAARRLALFPSA
jgi:hypothetical protein